MRRILFICNQNKHRSKTAKELFRNQFHTRSAGLYSKNHVSKQDLSWADVVMVMEEPQRSELAKRFPRLYMEKRILSLDIPDIYGYNDPKLVNILKQKVKEYKQFLR